MQMRALTAVASAKAGVRVQQPLQICLECRSKSKKCDKQLTHIVRVSLSIFVKFYYWIQVPNLFYWIIPPKDKYLPINEIVKIADL